MLALALAHGTILSPEGFCQMASLIGSAIFEEFGIGPNNNDSTFPAASTLWFSMAFMVLEASRSFSQKASQKS
jgi:hypothetical protein